MNGQRNGPILAAENLEPLPRQSTTNLSLFEKIDFVERAHKDDGLEEGLRHGQREHWRAQFGMHGNWGK
jgi:hypothetical protein